LAGTQESPTVHVTQAPPLHTLSVPQGVPFGVLPDSMQTGDPVLHAVVPVRHGLLAMVHVDPATHAMQVPVSLHTLSWPQVAPGGRFMPVSPHVGVGVEQSSFPTWQALVGVHDSPVTHGLQAPSWQTVPVPQGVPLGLLLLAIQTGAPVEHSMVPVRHAWPATSHIVPAAHAWQAPSKQTPLSQGVPLAWLRWVSRQEVPPPSLQIHSP